MTSEAKPTIPIVRRLIASALTALGVALTVHLVTIFVFAVSGAFAAESIPQTHDYFLPASLISFVIVFLLALAGAFRWWYAAIAAGVFTGVVASVAGSIVNATGTGTTITTALVGPLFATISTINLTFFVASIVTAATLGRRVWLAVVGASVLGLGDAPKIALVRLPSDNLADGELTHIKRKKIDTALADEQWDNYVAALTENGWETIEVAPAPQLADAVFIEDAIVLFGNTAVITSPGAESRRPEIVDAETTVRELGLSIERIVLPGTLDGGDVLKVGQTVYVGRGGRTNAEGIRQLRSIVSPLGYTVVAVPITKVLHLKSAVTALPDGTVIGYAPLVDDVSIFDRFLAMPEEAGSHVVVLSDDTVLMAASAPKSAAIIEDLGYRVVSVDISEFEKLEGCVTCLSVRVR